MKAESSTIYFHYLVQLPSNQDVLKNNASSSSANFRNEADRCFGQIRAIFLTLRWSQICNFYPEVIQQVHREDTGATVKDARHQVEGVLDHRDIKYQEAVYELSQDKQGLIKNLHLARKGYHDPTLKFSASQKSSHIFVVGCLHTSA